MTRPTFDEIWLNLAWHLSKRSTCSRLKVGSVVVSEDNCRVLAVGYNGGAKGVFNDCLSDEPGKCGHAHAEINSLVKMDYNDPVRKKMYLTHLPCLNCSIMIINAGIMSVTYTATYRDRSGLDMLRKAGIEVTEDARLIRFEEDGEEGVV